MVLAPGTEMGRYKILDVLGSGGVGEVYRARDLELGRDVALKLLPGKVVRDRMVFERFIREARTTSALNHPNIVTIYDIGDSKAGRFIAMELVAGRTLRAMMSQRLPVKSIVQLIEQVAKALAVAHAAGVVHRDIKPENIMLRDDGYIKVLDFGLARLLAADEEASTIASEAGTGWGTLLGTIRYMSPEQARGQSVGGPTDIFSLGIVLYELTTGRHPFIADSNIEILHAILSSFPLSPSRLNPEIDSALEALVLQMLEKDGRLRPSAMELENLLAEIAGQRARREAPAHLGSTRQHTVGREKERAELRAALESAAAGHGLLLCVPGEPGIGKTTLVENFLAELTASGESCRIGRGRCSERLAGTEAYLPYLEALESLLHAEAGDSVARVMKSIAPSWYAQVVPCAVDFSSFAQLMADIKATSQERLKRELSALLQEISRVQPLILFFDDLQWADVSTIDLLGYISSRIASMRMLMIVSYRQTDLLLANHPFLPLKLDLQGRGICREVPLDFLSCADVERYLELEFPKHRFQKGFPAIVHAKTDGNPLFMVDLLRYLRNGMIIRQAEGYWTLAQPIPDLEHEMPESVRSMIQKKIDQLEDRDRKLLAAASVQGHEFNSAVLSKALAADAAEVEERLQMLDRVHAFVRLVREMEFPDRTLTLRYRFVHVLYQNALYASLTPARRASLSAAVAEALVKYYGGSSQEIASELALLFETARDFSRAAHYFLFAAQSAVRVFANQEAIALAQRGLESLRALPESVERARQELMLLITLGGPLMTIKGYASPEAQKTYRRARELCELLGDSQQLFSVLLGMDVSYLAGAEHETGRRLAEEMMRVAEAQADPDLLVAAHHLLGFVLSLLGELAPACEHLDRATELYKPQRHLSHAFLYSIDIGVSSWCQKARTLWLLGYPDRAAGAIRKALTLAQELSHPGSCSFASLVAANIGQLRREVQRTLESAQAAMAVASEHELDQISAWARVWYGWALGKKGKLEEAISQMREALSAQLAIGSQIIRPHFLALLAETLAEAGQQEEGLNVLADALTQAQNSGERYYEAELHRLNGELLVARAAGSRAAMAAYSRSPICGKPAVLEKADHCFRVALDIARRQGAKSWELRAASSLYRLCKQQRRKENETRETLSEIYQGFTEGFDTADLKEARALLEES